MMRKSIACLFGLKRPTLSLGDKAFPNTVFRITKETPSTILENGFTPRDTNHPHQSIDAHVMYNLASSLFISFSANWPAFQFVRGSANVFLAKLPALFINPNYSSIVLNNIGINLFNGDFVKKERERTSVGPVPPQEVMGFKAIHGLGHLSFYSGDYIPNPRFDNSRKHAVQLVARNDQDITDFETELHKHIGLANELTLIKYEDGVILSAELRKMEKREYKNDYLQACHGMNTFFTLPKKLTSISQIVDYAKNEHAQFLQEQGIPKKEKVFSIFDATHKPSVLSSGLFSPKPVNQPSPATNFKKIFTL